MRIFGYVRVSSIEQESGHGPEVQEQAIRAYADLKKFSGITMVHESASAESVAGRKELLKLLATARDAAGEGEKVHIIFRSSDRLARDLIDQESVVANSFSIGYRLHSTQAHEAELFDPAFASDPMRTAIRQFFGIFNQLDKAIIKSRLDGGLYVKAAQGGSTGGRYPFGYQADNGEIAVCREEAPPIRRAFELHGAGIDLGSIAAVLMHEFPEVCARFGKSQVKRIIDRSELYQHGHYRSRLATDSTIRKELIVAPPVVGTKEPALHARVRGEPINWAAVPDPVPCHTLALLLARPLPWVHTKVAQLTLFVKYTRGRMFLPHDSARQVESAAAKEQ